jgi:hypothetical protein
MDPFIDQQIFGHIQSGFDGAPNTHIGGGHSLMGRDYPNRLQSGSE